MTVGLACCPSAGSWMLRFCMPPLASAAGASIFCAIVDAESGLGARRFTDTGYWMHSALSKQNAGEENLDCHGQSALSKRWLLPG